jgi:hypothetical protein
MAPFALARARGKAVRFNSVDDNNDDDGDGDGYETEKPRKESRWRFIRRESAEDEKKVEVEEEVVWQIPAVAAVAKLERRSERRSELSPFFMPVFGWSLGRWGA